MASRTLLVVSLVAVVFLPWQLSAQEDASSEVFSFPTVSVTGEDDHSGHDHADHADHDDHDHAAHSEAGGGAGVSDPHDDHDHHDDHHDHDHSAESGMAGVSQAEADAELAAEWETFPIEYRWLAGIIAGIILTVNSLIGMCLLQCLGKGVAGKILQYALVILSISVMVSDSMMHIYPHAIEGASHDTVAKLGITAFAGSLACVLFSQLMNSLHRGHKHTHHPGMAIPAARTSATVADDADTTPSKEGKMEEGKIVEQGEKEKFDWRSVESFGWAALAGDLVCNFVDGLSIGVAWYVGWFVGLVTSIAILAHEIPQELSDYAVLRLSGLTNCLVIGINIVSSLTSFVGIAIGLGISTLLDEVVEEFARYCLAFTTGAWLAIALLLLTPIALKLFVEMTHKGPDGQPPVLGWFPVSLVTALMMAVALGIMAAIGVLEGMTHAHGGHEGHGHEGHDH